MTSFGCALPPELLKRRQQQEEEEEAKNIGPALPPHLSESRKRKSESEPTAEDDAPEEKVESAETKEPPVKRRMVGPALEDLVKEDSEEQTEEGEKEARPVLGPLPAAGRNFFVFFFLTSFRSPSKKTRTRETNLHRYGILCS